MNKKIKAVIFDVDGTLYSNLTMLFSSPLRYTISLRWIYHYNRMRKKLRKYLSTVQYHSKEAMEAKSIEFFSQEIHKENRIAKQLLVEKINKVWIAGLKKTNLRIGMTELLQSLQKYNFKLGVLSDFPAIEKLKNWNILDLFDSIISAEEHGRLKPDPYLFHLAARQLGAKIDECVYVGNHVHYDGYGAYHAGMHNLIFARHPFVAAQKNIHFIYCMKDIYSYVMKGDDS